MQKKNRGTQKKPIASIKPIGKYVLVELAPVTNKTTAGLILVTPKREPIALIIAVGPKVTEVEVGDEILFQNGDFKLVQHKNLPDGADYALIHEDHIIGVFDQ